MDRYADMEAALRQLWDIPSPQPDGIYQHPAFKAVEGHCRSNYPNAARGLFTPFAIWHGLYLLGVPCTQPPGLPPVELADGARGMVDNLEKEKATRRYIAPLDMAGDIPHLTFGNAEVKRFSADELRILFEEATVRRQHSGPVEFGRLAEFHWLVVEDQVDVSRTIGARLNDLDLGRDMGAIVPHADRFPEPLMKALFALLLQPWEDWHSYGEMDWRPFAVPWVHVVTGDIFERPNALPSPDSLTWEPAFDSDGNEYERPLVIHPGKDADTGLAHIGNAYWDKLKAARCNVLFETPVEHFMLRAFFSSGMDEIMAHSMAIEAALGLKSDFSSKRNGGLGPSDVIAARMSALFEDPDVCQGYKDLFRLRSNFVHGRSMKDKISSRDRKLARSLARRTVEALVEKAATLRSGVTRK